MADVTRSESRGQLFLVGAVSLALVFVVLAVVLNSAIYTGNLATRGTDSASVGAAMDTRDDVEGNAADLLVHVNDGQSTYADQTTAVERGVVNLSRRMARYASTDGRALSVTYSSYTEGTGVEQSSASEFTDDDGTVDWTVAASTGRTRSFAMNVDGSSLDGSTSTPFTVVFDGADGVTWRLVVYEDGSGNTVVEVEEDGTSLGTCTAGSDVRVGVTDATVDGRRCPALERLAPAVPYDLGFENGDSAAGTYSLVTSKTETNVADAPYDDSGDPTKSPRLYNLTAHFEYRSDAVVYETALSILPGGTDV
jgi:hypothetical protein